MSRLQGRSRGGDRRSRRDTLWSDLSTGDKGVNGTHALVLGNRPSRHWSQKDAALTVTAVKSPPPRSHPVEHKTTAKLNKGIRQFQAHFSISRWLLESS